MASAMAAAMLLALSINAFASGYVNGTMSGTGSGTSVKYTFNVDGSGSTCDGYQEGAAHDGAIGSLGFSVSDTKNYTLSYSGTDGNAEANVYIYSEKTNTITNHFSIPVRGGGMPTITTTIKLNAGQYYVKVISASCSTYSTGSFTLSGISGTYNHS